MTQIGSAITGTPTLTKMTLPHTRQEHVCISRGGLEIESMCDYDYAHATSFFPGNFSTNQMGRESVKKVNNNY